MKLWDKGKKTDNRILEFTIGNDRRMDSELAAYDVIASIAHVIMLESVKLLRIEERNILVKELSCIYSKIISGDFCIEEGIEDIHSQVEKLLTDKLGETGKKIHTARSRNDQVLADLKLYYRHQTVILVKHTDYLVKTLITKGKENRDEIIPGYTHLQVAMPSSFGLWFGAFAESLVEDLIFHEGIMRFINQNPLGSAAGYGSSFPINREMTTSLLEFDDMHINSINAQMSRGKVEKFIAAGLGSIASSLSKMCMDITLFMSQNFNFIQLKEEFTTGSSIMPHKKNPDVIEIIRAKCNRISSLYVEVQLLTQNLPSGYHRDYQLLKEMMFPAYNELYDCLEMINYVIENLIINKNIIEDEKYKGIYSVENVNEKVKEGISFREAYSQVADEISKGQYKKSKGIKYTHTGSIGNPGFEEIIKKRESIIERLGIERYISFEERFISKIREM
jgi:argininosuccinate lyase